MHFFDTHAHLADPAFGDEILYYLQESRSCGVQQAVSISTDLQTLQEGRRLRKITQEREELCQLYLSAGTGPGDVVEQGELFWPHILSALEAKELVAIGEVGLDLYWREDQLSEQIDYFCRCCALARVWRVPLLLHCRDRAGERRAFDQLLGLLDRHLLDQESTAPPILWHCFSYTKEEAQLLRQRGILLSISGVITYKSAAALEEVIKEVDAAGYVLETDAPYLTPRPRSLLKEVLGESKLLKVPQAANNLQLNRPTFIAALARRVAQLRGCSLEQVAMESTSNARRLFGLDSHR